jgi:RNA polymerase sigma-70 factor (ECF subfamily)
MTGDGGNTDMLLDRARDGDGAAIQRLLAQHRSRLRRMVAVRMDPRVAARIDASDVVQEALVDATRKLPEYLERGGCAFYPWLRRIAWERLVKLHRFHIDAQRRSVNREANVQMRLSDRSTVLLADQLAASGTSIPGQMVRRELHERVRTALDRLPAQHREVVVLRNLEQLTFREVAEVLHTTEAAARSRYGRAIERLHDVLSEGSEEAR